MAEWDRLLRHEDYNVEIFGMNIHVKDRVFTPDPAVTNSTSFLLANLPNVRGKKILDVGTGTGVIAIYCALNGAKKVVASDIDDHSLDNAKINVKKYGLGNKIFLIKSDLFEHIEGKFDYILANLPILKGIWNEKEKPENLTARYLRDSKNYILKGGKVYFTWASFSDVRPVKFFCKDFGYIFRIFSENNAGYEWYVFEVSH